MSVMGLTKKLISLTSGGRLFKWKGFWISFLASCLLAFIVVGYCLIRITNDSVMKSDTEISNSPTNEIQKIHKDPVKEESKFLKPVFDFLRNLISAFFRPRVGDLKIIMGLLFCSKMVGYAGQMMVEGNLLFLYTEDKFTWTVDQYSTWFGVYNVFVCIGVIIVGPILNEIFSNPLQVYIASIFNGMFYFFVALANPQRRYNIY